MPVRKSGFCLLKKFLLEDKVIAQSWLPWQRPVSLKLEGEETRLFEENGRQDVVTEWILWMTLSSSWLLFMMGTYACKIHKSSGNSKTLHRCLVWEERQSYSSTLASCYVPFVAPPSQLTSLNAKYQSHIKGKLISPLRTYPKKKRVRKTRVI